MNKQEIQAAVLAGKTAWADGVTMNGKPEEFSVAGVTLVDQMRAAGVTLVDQMRAALEAVDRADTYVHERGAALAMVRAVLKGGNSFPSKKSPMPFGL